MTFRHIVFFVVSLFSILPTHLHGQSLGMVQENSNLALPNSYNFKEYVFAEPDDQGTCNGTLNSSAQLKGVFFSQTHRQEINHAFFFIIGHRPALFQVAIEGSGDAPDVKVEGIINDAVIGSLCLKGPSTLKSNINLAIPSFEDYFSVTIPKSWLKEGLSLRLIIGDQIIALSKEQLKISPYTELNLVEVKMDVMDYNKEEHRSAKPEDLLEELASAIPVSVVRYGEFPETLVYPELIANNDTEQLARLKSKYKKEENGIFSDGYINSVMALAVGNLQNATGDYMSTVYFGNTLNLDPGGWGGGNTFVSPDYTDVFIHELGHALNLPHWGEGSFGNTDANMYEYNYPYGGAFNDGGGRGESWTFNQDLYEFINPICQYDERGEAGLEASDAMQRNNHCLEQRADGQGPWDGFGDFSAYAMNRYFVGDPLVKTGVVDYKGEDIPFQFRFEIGFPVVSLENGERVYTRQAPLNEERFNWQEVLDLPGQEELNTDVYLIYGTIHESQAQANIVYKPIKFNGTLPTVIDPTDPNTFEELKGEEFSLLGEKDITLKLTYKDGSVKHVLNTYHSFARAPYTWGYHIWRDDLCNFSMIVPADKDLQKVEVYVRPFASYDSGNETTGNINDASQNITAENFMDAAIWKSEYVFGGEKVLGLNRIGNRVWNDLNRNGKDDFDEPGIEGVKLLLWADSNEDGIPDSEGYSGLQVTDEDGRYEFPIAKPGNYIVFVWSVDNWEEGGPLHNMKGVDGHSDPNDDINSDDNGRPGGFPGLSDLDIASGIITITEDGEPLNDGDQEDDWFDFDPSGNLTIDFGFYQESACPVLNVEVNGKQVLCEGELGIIELLPAEGQGPFTYLWNDGLTANTLEGLDVGTYEVTFTNGQSCEGSISIEVRIIDPIEMIISGPDSLCQGETTSLNFTISGGEGPYAIVASGEQVSEYGIGTYSFTVTDDNNCTAEFSKTITEADEVACTSSTIENEDKVALAFAPNPFIDLLYITNPTSKKFKMHLYSITGQLVGSEVISSGRNELNLGRLNAGMFICVVSDDQGKIVSTKRVVKN